MIGTRLQKITPFWLIFTVSTVALLPPTVSIFRHALRWAQLESSQSEADALAAEVTAQLSASSASASAKNAQAELAVDPDNAEDADILQSARLAIDASTPKALAASAALVDDAHDVPDFVRSILGVSVSASIASAGLMSRGANQFNRVSSLRCYGSVAVCFFLVVAANFFVSPSAQVQTALRATPFSAGHGVYVPGEVSRVAFKAASAASAASAAAAAASHAPNWIGIQCGSAVYWTLLVLVVPAIGFIVLQNAQLVRTMYHADEFWLGTGSSSSSSSSASSSLTAAASSASSADLVLYSRTAVDSSGTDDESDASSATIVGGTNRAAATAARVVDIDDETRAVLQWVSWSNLLQLAAVSTLAGVVSGHIGVYQPGPHDRTRICIHAHEFG
jgi:hypothetical protein